MPSPRDIPSIDLLRKRGRVQRLEEQYGPDATVDALRAAADAARQRLRTPGDTSAPDAEHEDLASAIETDAEARLLGRFQGSLRPVINATGVIIHTNLGRAPLARAAIDRIAATAGGYTNLEYDLAKGSRGSRAVHAEALLTTLTGAEAAVVVNNNAAATLLMLAALAQGREVLISRGELVEIGGGFRVPDVMAQSGADLREIGTTNRTRVADYTVAAGPRTALILRVHPSNFRVEGFAERPTLTALVNAGRTLGIPVVEDLGSGNLDEGLADEPSVRGSLAAGADLVCFSGDKLLGGPQAGILAGRRALVDRLRRHPLMRAFRVDKLTYAALEATLLEYLAGRAGQTVPVRRMLATDVDAIEARARALADRLVAQGWRVSLVSGSSAVGGGSAPGLALPTVLVAIEREGLTAHALEARLRVLDPPVIARIVDDRVALDLRTVPPESDQQLGLLLEGV
ncbi:MAG: L-seryl-tRNA(Sec) selenium transferase [Vicinamibacterales bacterium]